MEAADATGVGRAAAAHRGSEDVRERWLRERKMRDGREVSSSFAIRPFNYEGIITALFTSCTRKLPRKIPALR
jgi:hypothetical protein